MALRPLAAALIAVLLLAPAPPALAEDLTPVLAAAMAGTQVPAMAILVIQDGKIAGQAVRGVRRNDAPDPARIGDVWHIGSDGKAMTASSPASSTAACWPGMRRSSGCSPSWRRPCARNTAR